MLSDTGGEMNDKICITAIFAIVLICGIPTTFGQQCTPGAEFIITYDNVTPFADLNICRPRPQLLQGCLEVFRTGDPNRYTICI